MQCSFEVLLEKMEMTAPQGSDDAAMLQRARELAVKAYNGKTVKGGRPLLEHSVNVACILADYQLDPKTICAALLHNLDPAGRDADDLQDRFDQEVIRMLELLASLNVLKFSPNEIEQANQLRKMFIAMAKEWRIIMIKLANRLEIMRHLDSFPEEERETFARETLEIFAPLGHRLGVSQLKNEIEDLAFQWLYPDEYADLKDNVQALSEQRDRTLQRSIDEMKTLFRNSGVQVHITGRTKHLFSMYKKMLRQGLQFSELFDILAVRIIVDKVEECYRVLSMLHTQWTPVPDTFDDYIQDPKPNGYQSLHTVVVGPGRLPVEIQIRTWDMHETAEYGVAAHWRYKEEAGGGHVSADAAEWIHREMDRGALTEDPMSFLQQISLDHFEDKVFVLTPGGRVLALPAGSTPVDAAYRIHTEVGHRCQGARLNNRIVPLETALHNGDVVEIITGKINRPSRDWLNFVRSAGARQKIRAWFKQANRAENIVQGKEMLLREMDRAGLKRKDLLDRIGLESSYKAVKLKSEEDLYAAIGCGDVSVEGVLNRLRRDYTEMLQKEEPVAPKKTAASSVRRKKSDVMVEGLSDVMVSFSKCCYPVPGDDIVGFVSTGRSINIHRRDCPNIQKYIKERERIVPVNWADGAEKSLYFTLIEIHSLDRRGLLNDVMAIINETKLHAIEVKSHVLKDTTLLTLIRVEVSDHAQVDTLIARFRQLEDVISIRRKI